MNENQQNFESLRRLLALKRHETPPPGYFNNFSRQVMARIRAGEAEASVSLSERFGMPWLLKWLQGAETKPMFAGSFATVLCLLLLFGAVIAQRPEAASQAFLQPAARDAALLPMIASAAPMAPPALEQSAGQIMINDNSTNPVINFASAPVGQMPVSAQFASFAAGN
jgi:hypothetical protein